MKHLSDSNFNDNKLVNVPIPINATDAANKEYADTKVQGVNTSKITVSSTEPSASQDGDIWINPDEVSGLLPQIVNIIYPVGKLWWSNDATNPGTILGVGTWVRLQGRFIIPVDDSDPDFALNATGGAKAVTLTAAQSGLPAHNHPITDPGHNHASYRSLTANSGTARWSVASSEGNTTTGTSETGITIDNNTAQNASQAHNNLPPYLGKYCFERIA